MRNIACPFEWRVRRHSRSIAIKIERGIDRFTFNIAFFSRGGGGRDPSPLGAIARYIVVRSLFNVVYVRFSPFPRIYGQLPVGINSPSARSRIDGT